MTRKALVPLLVVLAVAAILTPGASARRRPATACPQLFFRASVEHPATYRGVCRGNITPNVYVNGHTLTTATMYHNTCTFYGNSTVVRLHQAANRVVTITASTVAPRPVRVRVRIMPTAP